MLQSTLNSTPYDSMLTGKVHDIETGNARTNFKLEGLEKRFLEFKEETERKIYEIRERTHPPCIVSYCASIFNWGFIASYIVLWLIVFHIL